MRPLALSLTLLLAAAAASADCGVLAPGQDMHFGNLHVANLEGAGGNVNWCDDGRNLVLLVQADAFCAVLKRGDERQARDVLALVLGDGYYAQANVSGAYVAGIGDNSVALSLALRARHRNNANTIELMGNGNIAAAVRWCFGRGEVLMNRIRFGVNAQARAHRNDAYISGDREGTFDLAWANRTLDVAGRGNRTFAFNGFPCRPVTDAEETDERPADLARDVADLDPDRTKTNDTAVAASGG